ncbi:MAG: cytochrome c biogenesis CcdA family protein, partial [Candidatus Woesearchaeota archaeon]
MNKKIIYPVVFLFFIATALALELPKGLQVLVEYSQKQALALSFLVAFLGGVLSFLSPCVLPLLPAFFAYAFEEKKQITKMTLAFFLGSTSVFILLGLTASFIGQILSAFRAELTIASGVAIIIFGIMTLLNKGFVFIHHEQKGTKHFLEVLIFGALFAIGFTPCVGPILASILFVASTQTYINAATMLFFYSLGVSLPLFIFAMLYDKYKLSQVSWIKGKPIKFLGVKTHTNKIIAGAMLLITGIVFVTYQSTAIYNGID